MVTDTTVQGYRALAWLEEMVLLDRHTSMAWLGVMFLMVYGYTTEC